MKDLKAILEVGRNTKDNKISKNLSASLNIANMNNILFALAYTYKHDDEADKWKRAEYESLYFSLYNFSHLLTALKSNPANSHALS